MKALTLGIALLAVVGFAQAEDVKAQIEAGNKAVAQAMLKKDFATLEKIMKTTCTPDFKYQENAKTPAQNLTQMLANMKMGLGMMKKVSKADTKLLNLKVTGNKAVGSAQHHMEGVMSGEDKKEHTMTFKGVAEQTYVKQGGKWKMSKMIWKSQTSLMDGKPMQGMGG